jgi:hypothetical protein
VTVRADGSFSLDARPGYAKLALRSPLGEPVAMLLLRELLVEQDVEPQVFAIETGGIEGTAERAQKLRLHHRIDAKTHIEAVFDSGADGAFRVAAFAAGHASLQNEVDGQPFGRQWRDRAKVELTAGETLKVER